MSDGKFLAGLDLGEEKKGYTYTFKFKIGDTVRYTLPHNTNLNPQKILAVLATGNTDLYLLSGGIASENEIKLVDSKENQDAATGTVKVEGDLSKGNIEKVKETIATLSIKKSRTIRDILIDKAIEDNKKNLKEKFLKAINEKLDRLGKIVTYRISLNCVKYSSIQEAQNKIEDFKKLRDKLMKVDFLETTEDEFLELANKAFNTKGKTLNDLLFYEIN